jgi:uncharacterized alkaline shock family protein YloU
VNEFQGISTILSGFKSGIIPKITKRNGITILEKEDGITIELRVSIILGENILNTCAHLQKVIIEEILELTGIHVSSVHIFIDDLLLECRP